MERTFPELTHNHQLGGANGPTRFGGYPTGPDNPEKEAALHGEDEGRRIITVLQRLPVSGITLARMDADSAASIRT